MKREILKEHRIFYLEELKRVLDFWLKNGFDQVNHGFYTSLDKQGRVFNQDKSVWAQGRVVYIFSQAYLKIDRCEEWKNVAIKTYDFMKRHCFDKDGKMYFSVTDKGEGIQKRRYWFSEAFFVMAAVSMYEISKEKKYLEDARTTYDFIVNRYKFPELNSPKYNPLVVNLRDLSSTMIFLSLAQYMNCVDIEYSSRYALDVSVARNNILKLHYHKEKKALFEFVNLDGSLNKGPKGRLINPGHALECAWFLLEGEYDQDTYLKAKDIAFWSYDLGLDKSNGGLKYFVDVEGLPLEQLEHDMKLWWVHCEGLIVFLKLYLLEESDATFKIYQEIFDYTINNFIVDDYEWLGYLHYDNTIASSLKGNMFKGPFHIPRMLMMNYLVIDKYLKEIDE